MDSRSGNLVNHAMREIYHASKNRKVLAQELANELNATVMATTGHNALTSIHFSTKSFALAEKAFHPNKITIKKNIK
jgi:hypothetical protein